MPSATARASDDGYTGAVLERPRQGRIEAVVHAPDRLSRRYAYRF